MILIVLLRAQLVAGIFHWEVACQNSMLQPYLDDWGIAILLSPVAAQERIQAYDHEIVTQIHTHPSLEFADFPGSIALL